MPFLTLIKVIFLLGAAVAAFTPRLAEMRLPFTLAAVIMMFVPSFAAIVAAVHPWTSLRAELTALAKVNSIWIDPGWGMVALVVAALMMMGAVTRRCPAVE